MIFAYHPRTKTSHVCFKTILVTLYRTSSEWRGAIQSSLYKYRMPSSLPRRPIAVNSSPCIPSSQYAACNKIPPWIGPAKVVVSPAPLRPTTYRQIVWDLQRTDSLSETYNVNLSETYNEQRVWELQRTASLWGLQRTASLWDLQRKSLWDLKLTVTYTTTVT